MAHNLKTRTFQGDEPKEVLGMANAMHGYNATQKRFIPITVSDSGSIETSSVGGFSNYESKEISPGAGTNGYNVKTTGSMFSSVTTSYRTIITNNDSSEDIIIYLNSDNINPITISPSSTFEVNNFGVTNIFIDTVSGQTGTVEIILFG